MKIDWDDKNKRLIFGCECVVVNREEEEQQRDWLKRCMCMHHWTQTDYYRAKLEDTNESK